MMQLLQRFSISRKDISDGDGFDRNHDASKHMETHFPGLVNTYLLSSNLHPQPYKNTFIRKLDSLPLMLPQEPRRGMSPRPLPPLPRPGHVSSSLLPPMHSSPLATNSSSSFLDLRSYPHISARTLSASRPSAQWADPHGAPANIVVGRSIPPPKNSTSSSRVSATRSYSTTQPALSTRNNEPVDYYKGSSGNGDSSIITSSPDHNLTSFPWRLFPKPPSSGGSSMQQSKLSFRPTTAQAILDPPHVENLPSTNLSSRSTATSTISRSPSGSFFQYPHPHRNMAHPYAYSSSDITTVSDTHTEETSTCIIGAEADGGAQASVGNYHSDPLPDVQSINLGSSDGPRPKRSPFLSLRRSKYNQDGIVIPKIPFDEHRMPTDWQLSLAASLHVLDENGARVRFGDLWEKQRTVVCFIRHFWCPMCQDYITSIMRSVPHPSTLARHNPSIRLCIISNGSPHMIASYKRMFDLPFDLYVDPTLVVYRALGMTKRTLKRGPEAEKGSYVKHGPVDGMASVIARSARVRAPVWRGIGDLMQLGGEFVLGPATAEGMGKNGEKEGRKCFYAHRMTHMRSHRPIEEVMKAAGLDLTMHREENIRCTIHGTGDSSIGHDIASTSAETETETETEGRESQLLHARMEYMRWLREQKDKDDCQCGPIASSSNSSAAMGENSLVGPDVDAEASYWDEDDDDDDDGFWDEDEEYIKAYMDYADACGLEGRSFLEI